MLNKLLGRWLWEEDDLNGHYRKGIVLFNFLVPLTPWKKRIVLQ